MTTLVEQMEAAVAALTANAQSYFQKDAAIQAQLQGFRTGLQAQFITTQAQLVRQWIIHPANGDDAAAGDTSAAPLRSVAEALRRTPVGGRCVARLIADLTLTAPVLVEDRHLELNNVGTGAPGVTFTTAQPFNGVARVTNGIELSGRASLRVGNVRLTLPSLGAGQGALSLTPLAAAIRPANPSGTPFTSYAGWHTPSVDLVGMTLAVPATPHGPLIGGVARAMLRLAADSVTIEGTAANNIVLEAQGADPDTLPWLWTNMVAV